MPIGRGCAPTGRSCRRGSADRRGRWRLLPNAARDGPESARCGAGRGPVPKVARARHAEWPRKPNCRRTRPSRYGERNAECGSAATRPAHPTRAICLSAANSRWVPSPSWRQWAAVASPCNPATGSKSGPKCMSRRVTWTWAIRRPMRRSKRRLPAEIERIIERGLEFGRKATAKNLREEIPQADVVGGRAANDGASHPAFAAGAIQVSLLRCISAAIGGLVPVPIRASPFRGKRSAQRTGRRTTWRNAEVVLRPTPNLNSHYQNIFPRSWEVPRGRKYFLSALEKLASGRRVGRAKRAAELVGRTKVRPTRESVESLCRKSILPALGRQCAQKFSQICFGIQAKTVFARAEHLLVPQRTLHLRLKFQDLLPPLGNPRLQLVVDATQRVPARRRFPALRACGSTAVFPRPRPQPPQLPIRRAEIRRASIFRDDKLIRATRGE